MWSQFGRPSSAFSSQLEGRGFKCSLFLNTRKFNGFIWRHGLMYIVYSSVSQPFFDSRHPSLFIKQFGGTPNYNLLVNRCQVQKLSAPLEFFTAPKGSAVPRLRTTGLFRLFNVFFVFSLKVFTLIQTNKHINSTLNKFSGLWTNLLTFYNSSCFI